MRPIAFNLALCIAFWPFIACKTIGLLPDLYKKHVDDWVGASALGVQHATLPGRLSVSEVMDLEGNMHIFIRAIRSSRDPDQLVLRGVVFWDRTWHPMLAQESYLAVPAEWGQGHLPRVALQLAPAAIGAVASNATKVAATQNWTVSPPSDVSRPLLLKAVLPAVVDAGWLLRVGDRQVAWRRAISLQGALAAAVADDATYPSTANPPRVYTVLGPPHLNAKLTARLVVAHTDWHHHQGFAGTMLYMRSEHLAVLVQQESLLDKVDSGALSLIAFDYFPLIPNVPMYLQNVIYNHALLSVMGRGVWLFLAEVDELMMTRVPGAINEKVTSCLVGEQEKVAQVFLLIYDVICPECTTHSGEWGHWLLDSSSGLAAVQQYNWRSLEPLEAHKAIVNADFVYQYGMHDGHVARGYTQHQLQNGQCAAVARMPNLFQHRKNHTEGFDTDTAWHWPIEQPVVDAGGRGRTAGRSQDLSAKRPQE